jgi:hypothetical protein
MSLYELNDEQREEVLDSIEDRIERLDLLREEAEGYYPPSERLSDACIRSTEDFTNSIAILQHARTALKGPFGTA